MPKKILIIPARRHILEAYTEYIISRLSDEFYFEMGYPPYPPYDNIRERVWTNETTPLHKNPDEFDLVYPHFTTHFFLEPPEKYYKKMALVFLEPGNSRDKCIMASTSKAGDRAFGDIPHHSLRFAVDSDLFRPFPMVRTDDLLHVGFIGNIQTPRRYTKDLFIDALQDIEGVRLMVFPTSWSQNTRVDEIESMGGQKLIDSVVDGDKWYPGLPNLYNQMDVYLRVDINHGYQFSVFEAAACGVPVICTDSGPTGELAEAGGAMSIDNGNGDQEGSFDPENLKRVAKEIREKVIFLRDNPKERKMIGDRGRRFTTEKWTWDRFIPAWREFFREGLKRAV